MYTFPAAAEIKLLLHFFTKKWRVQGSALKKTARAPQQNISLHTAPVEAARCAVQEIGTLPRAEGLGDAGAFAGRFNGEAQAGQIDFRQY